jgi:hypothetical protein
LEDTRESWRKILCFIEGLTREEFEKDPKTYDAVVRNLEIIGEATRLVPDSIRGDLPEVEWGRFPACAMSWRTLASGSTTMFYGTRCGTRSRMTDDSDRAPSAAR